MRLTQLAIMALRGSDDAVERLATALGVGQSTVYRYIKDNSDELTKAAALVVIRDITGLKDDMILDAEPVTAK